MVLSLERFTIKAEEPGINHTLSPLWIQVSQCILAQAIPMCLYYEVKKA